MLDLFEPQKPAIAANTRRVLLMDAAGELDTDRPKAMPRRPSKFDGMSVAEIREYRRLQYHARKQGRSLVLPLRTEAAPKPALKPTKAARTRQTREQINAKKRQKYAERKAAGLAQQGRKTPYALLPEDEKQRRRDYQLARYYANRDKQLARAKAKFAALTPEQKAKRAALNRAWKQANRERVNRQDRERRAAKKARSA
jgi:hypothetical protein